MKVQDLRTKRLDITGRILDQNGEPVSDADIHAIVRYYPLIPNSDFSRSSRDTSTTSDANGFFVFGNVEGVSFTIKRISKDGYLFVKDGNKLFMLSNMRKMKLAKLSDNKTPMIYKAWKLSNYEGVNYKTMRFYVEPDGHTHTIDLNKQSVEKGKKVDGIYLTAYREYKPPPNYTHTPWYIKLAIPNGGIIETNDEFSYLAPVSGYEHEWEFSVSGTDDDWKYELSNINLYFVTGNNTYGIINLTVRPFYGYNHDKFQVVLKYGINKPGVKYLEPIQK